MVIDMNEARLETIEQIQEFLGGTADVAFSIPTDESTLRTFVATVLRRFDYFRLAKAYVPHITDVIGREFRRAIFAAAGRRIAARRADRGPEIAGR